MDLHGKVALVTGAGGGIGSATARLLASRGARVAVADFAVEAGEATVDAIRQSGGEAAFFAVDVTDASSVDDLVGSVVERFGSLDLALNNAGILHPARPFHELTESDWTRSMSVNAMGVANSMRAEIRVMLEQGGGAIVNTASGAGLGAAPDLAGYVASKHAVVGLTRAAAVEYVRQGLRVNAVAPGTVETPMTAGMTAEQRDSLNELMPMGRMAKPIEVAEVVAFLLSDEASYVNGAVVPIDGGSSASA